MTFAGGNEQMAENGNCRPLLDHALQKVQLFEQRSLVNDELHHGFTSF